MGQIVLQIHVNKLSLILLSVQSVVSMSCAFVSRGNPCSCYVYLCVGCWLSWEITKQTCCFRWIENVSEELTLWFFISSSYYYSPTYSASLSFLFFLACSLFSFSTQVFLSFSLLTHLRHYLSYQHLIHSYFPAHPCFISLLYILSHLSNLVFLLLLALHSTPTFSWVPAWMVTIVLLLAVGMKVGLLYKPGNGLRNG